MATSSMNRKIVSTGAAEHQHPMDVRRVGLTELCHETRPESAHETTSFARYIVAADRWLFHTLNTWRRGRGSTP